MLTPADTTRLQAWASVTTLSPIHRDCITTLMLKILDGKCKMGQREKDVVAVIYQISKDHPGQLLGAHHHALIARALAGMDDTLVSEVYEQRLYAETMISRPVMKAFKAWLREEGVLAGGAAGGTDDEERPPI
ncbi:hypothetical protein DLREEDagrD3_13240 [Denitratisoma sp. agr-D3]